LEKHLNSIPDGSASESSDSPEPVPESTPESINLDDDEQTMTEKVSIPNSQLNVSEAGKERKTSLTQSTDAINVLKSNIAEVKHKVTESS
jgi:hypothetical protein